MNTPHFLYRLGATVAATAMALGLTLTLSLTLSQSAHAAPDAAASASEGATSKAASKAAKRRAKAEAKAKARAKAEAKARREAAVAAAATEAAVRPPVAKVQTPAQRAELTFQRALERIRANQPAQAVTDLQSVLADRPDHHDARLLLGQVYLAQGQTTPARTVLQQGLAIDARHPGLRMSLARMQVQAGQSSAALTTLEGGLGSGVTPSTEYRAFHAVLLQAQGQHQRAVDQYASALREQPENAQWLVGLGVSLDALGRKDAAKEAFTRAQGSPQFNSALADVVAQYGVMP